jgi:phosphohistidine phosphatase
MNAYFLRHGIAEEQSSSGRDFDRVLTREGVQRMECEAKTIAKLDLRLDLIVTSPLLRAKQTAHIVAAELKIANRLVEDARAGGSFDTDAFAAMMRERADTGAILFVGHEPGMSTVIGGLTGASVDFKKGSLACVKLTGPHSLRGSLVWLLPAKFLAL